MSKLFIYAVGFFGVMIYQMIRLSQKPWLYADSSV